MSTSAELPKPSIAEDVIKKANAKEDISETLSPEALRDPNEQRTLIDKALEMRDKASVEHLAKELREAKERYKSAIDSAEQQEAARVLEDVEAKINEHAGTLADAEVPPPLRAAASVAKAISGKSETFWSKVGEWMKPLQSAFNWIKDQVQTAVKTVGPQVFSMFGIQLPEWLKPESKTLAALRDALRTAGMTLVLEEGDAARMAAIEAAFNDINATAEPPVSMPTFLQEIAEEAKRLQGGAPTVALRDVQIAAARVKNRRAKAAAPTEKPTTSSDK